MKKVEAVTAIEAEIEQDEVGCVGIERGLRVDDRLSLRATFHALVAGDPLHEVFSKESVVLDDKHPAFRNQAGGERGRSGHGEKNGATLSAGSTFTIGVAFSLKRKVFPDGANAAAPKKA